MRNSLRPSAFQFRKAAQLLLACLAFLTSTVLAAGNDPRDTISLVKRSVVGVGTYEPTRNPKFRFLGTGFVVGDGTLIVTNQHVVPAILDTERRENLVIAIPDNGKAQLRAATKQASDPEYDLALLRIEGKPLPALTIGDSNNVREGDDLLLTGFPLGEALGLVPVSHRAMVSAITPLTLPAARAEQLDARVLRQLTDAPISIFQLDATAYPGNSGSPLYLPSTGEVVGILNMVFVKGSKENALSQPSGISYAIPASYLTPLISRFQ